MTRFIGCTFTLALLGTLTAFAGQDDKVWRPFLSDDAYKTLAKRSEERMASLPNDGKGRAVELHILAGYARIAKGVAAKAGISGPVRDLGTLMNLFRSKAKQGEGIAEDLQYNAKLKNQNGIEALLNALAAKKLTDANAGKMAKELELLGARVAVIASLTLERGPDEKQKADVKLWNTQAITMRDAAIELAEAAHKKDTTGIFAASKRLENTCVECHSNFK